MDSNLDEDFLCYHLKIMQSLETAFLCLLSSERADEHGSERETELVFFLYFRAAADTFNILSANCLHFS